MAEEIDELLWWQTAPKEDAPQKRAYEWQCLMCGNLVEGLWFTDAEVTRFVNFRVLRPKCTRGHGTMWLDASTRVRRGAAA